MGRDGNVGWMRSRKRAGRTGRCLVVAAAVEKLGRRKKMPMQAEGGASQRSCVRGRRRGEGGQIERETVDEFQNSRGRGAVVVGRSPASVRELSRVQGSGEHPAKTAQGPHACAHTYAHHQQRSTKPCSMIFRLSSWCMCVNMCVFFPPFSHCVYGAVLAGWEVFSFALSPSVPYA